MAFILFFCSFIGFPLATFLYFGARKKLKGEDERYEAHRAELSQNLKVVQSDLSGIQLKINETESNIAKKKKVVDQLEKEIQRRRSLLLVDDMSVKEPVFEYWDSKGYREKIKDLVARQKDLVGANKAIVALYDGNYIDDKLKKTAATIIIQLLNHEVRSSIEGLTSRNANSKEKQIQGFIGKLQKWAKQYSLAISEEYLNLATRQFELCFQEKEMQRIEEEERQQALAAAREEMKLLQDIERAKQKEDSLAKALIEARREADKATPDEKEGLLATIASLEKKLKIANQIHEKARSMAEQTKTGYVYIISNAGSFGEDILKIGLTRRLNPEDRVSELSGASVPFKFDIHAMIQSDDAPSLEAALHREFDGRRVNKVNKHKEFFRVKIDEVERAVEKIAPNAKFHRDITGDEFRSVVEERSALFFEGENDEIVIEPDLSGVDNSD